MFSIIVPIYNVQNFINKGLQNLLNISYPEYEILLIDDGSTDNSGLLCDEWANKYNHISVFHKPNGGAGSARNLGIKKARGTYICFFDIDDEVDTNILTICKKHLDTEKPEMLIFSYDSYDQEYNINTSSIYKPQVFHTNKEIKDNYVDLLLGLQYNNGFVWNKVYKRDFLINNNLFFGNQRIQQDEIFNINIYPHLTHLTTIPDILYHYKIYYKGNTRSHYIPERIAIYHEVRNSFLNLYNNWKLNDVRMLSYLHNRYVNGIIYAINYDILNEKSIMTKHERNDKMKQIFSNDNIRGLKKLYFKALSSGNITLYKFIKFLDDKIIIVKKLYRKLSKRNLLNISAFL